MNIDLQSLIHNSTHLPSIPGVVAELLQIPTQDTDTDISTVASLIAHDPALTAKVLRFANSPIYATRQKVETLTRAVVVMGLNATLSVALSFSLTEAARKQQGERLDYPLFWRRSLLAAAAAREIGKVVDEYALEELFLAGLLQDIGMLAIDNLGVDAYRDLGDIQGYHDRVREYEWQRLSGDHAEAGAALLRHWQLAERTVTAVSLSHNPTALPLKHELGKFVRCVGLSGYIADFLIHGGPPDSYEELTSLSYAVLNLDRNTIDSIITRVSTAVPELESLFDVSLITEDYPTNILDQARETLTILNLPSKHLPDRREDPALPLNEYALQLCGEDGRDPLTGTFSRKFLETYLPDLLEVMHTLRRPLSVIFADVSNFEEIQQEFGGAASRVLTGVARILERNVRAGDVIVRYGDEIFLIILPGARQEGAISVCERITNACTALQLRTTNRAVEVSLAMGLVTDGDKLHFDAAKDLLAAANLALFKAKLSGKSKTTPYEHCNMLSPT